MSGRASVLAGSRLASDDGGWADATGEERASGGGYDQGAGFGGHEGFLSRESGVPHVRQTPATVTGDLDEDIVRRVVRAHIREVRGCYEAGLSKDPKLGGRLSVEFTISAEGAVTTSRAGDADAFADPSVVECIAKAVEAWRFPAPKSGEVQVSYPFILEPG